MSDIKVHARNAKVTMSQPLSSFTLEFGGGDSIVYRRYSYHSSTIYPLAKEITLLSTMPDI